MAILAEVEIKVEAEAGNPKHHVTGININGAGEATVWTGDGSVDGDGRSVRRFAHTFEGMYAKGWTKDGLIAMCEETLGEIVSRRAMKDKL